MKELKVQFQVKDLLLPIAPTVLSVILALFIAISNHPFVGKIISGVVALGFVAFTIGWYWFRYSVYKPDWILAQGVKIVNAKYANVTPKELAALTRFISKWWAGVMLLSEVTIRDKNVMLTAACVELRVGTSVAFFIKTKTISTIAGMAYGLCTGKSFIIGNGPKRFQLSLYAHEMAHVILMPFVSGPNEHHRLMDILGYNQAVNQFIANDLCNAQESKK